MLEILKPHNMRFFARAATRSCFSFWVRPVHDRRACFRHQLVWCEVVVADYQNSKCWDNLTVYELCPYVMTSLIQLKRAFLGLNHVEIQAHLDQTVRMGGVRFAISTIGVVRILKKKNLAVYLSVGSHNSNRQRTTYQYNLCQSLYYNSNTCLAKLKRTCWMN